MNKRIENALLSVRDTARFLDVHPNTLRNWTNQGLLPCYALNARGDRRFRREDIEEFLARHRREGGDLGRSVGMQTHLTPLDSHSDCHPAYDSRLVREMEETKPNRAALRIAVPEPDELAIMT